MHLNGRRSPFARKPEAGERYRRRTTTSSSSGSSGGTGGGGYAGGGYLGPFPARQGCPAGTVVAHRFGRGLDAKVQCKAFTQAQPAPRPAPAPAPVNTFTPTVTVSPTIQTQVSPQISPVFQQTGQGSQSAGTAMTAPGGQSGAPSNNDAAIKYQREKEQAQQRAAQFDRERASRAEEFERNRIAASEAFDRKVALIQLEREQASAAAPVDAAPPQAAPVTVPGAFIPPPQEPAPAPAPTPAKRDLIPYFIAGTSAVILSAVYAYNAKRTKK